MNCRVAMAIVSCIFITAGGFADWQLGPDAPFQYTRNDAAYFPDDGMVYFPGGRLPDGGTSGTVWSYDPIAETYADTGAVMPLPVSNFVATVLTDATGSGIYIIGGRPDGGGNVSAVQVYYPDTNTAVELTGDAWPADPMRLTGGQIAVDNVLYVFGGFNAGTSPYTFTETWKFDPMAAGGAKWELVPGGDLTIARGYIYSALMDGLIYAVGGDTFDGSTLIPVTSAERFDPANPGDGWDDAGVADLPEACGEGQGFGFDSDAGHELAGQMIVAAGGVWPEEWANCYLYDAATNIWNSFPAVNQARRNHAGEYIPVGDKPGLWIFGGRQGSDDNVLVESEYHTVGLPSPTPTATLGPGTPTYTPIPPTTTPTPTAAPTLTPTPPATVTPFPPTETPLPPTVTPTVPCTTGMTLEMPAHNFTAGDPCYLKAFACNGTEETTENVPIFVFLDIGIGEYWFAPSWVKYPPGVDNYTITLPPGMTEVEPQPIGEFIWPSGAGAGGPFFFWAGMLDDTGTSVLGEIDSWEFSFS